MLGRLLLILLAGCGRFGFEGSTQSGGEADAHTADLCPTIY